MTRMRVVFVVVVAMMLMGLRPAVEAQGALVGTYRWQLRPYCNVVTVNIIQVGAVYHLDGTDDQCGAARAASVAGLGFVNLDGTIGVGFTTVSPTGTPQHTNATVTMPGIGGSWRDSAGHSGSFVFTPGAGVEGSPRPTPPGGLAPGSITATQLAPNTITAAHIAPATITAAEIAPGVIPVGGVADGSVTTAKLADASVTTAKLASGAVTGSRIASGSITSAHFAAGALTQALQCQNTALATQSVAAGGTSNAVAPACAAGYTQTATNCEGSSWLMPIVFASGGTCSARNNDTVAATLRASRTCCRVP